MNFKRLSLTQAVTLFAIAGLSAGMAFSWPLWFSAARPSFPLLPLFGAAWREPAWWSWLSAGLLGLLLVFALLFPGRKVLSAALLLWVAALCCLDLDRLQPWVWLYGLLLGAGLWSRDEADTRDTWRWLIAAVYAWSGLHKLTHYFAEVNFAWFCAALPLTKPLASYPSLGYALAVLEMLFAFGLLWPRSRRVFRWLVVGMHASLVVLLSPWGLDWNTVVIPWNITLAGIVWLVFSEKDDTRWPRSHGQKLVIALAAGGPLLLLFGAWPDPLSWKLYSNTQPEATFYAPAGAFDATPLQTVWEQNAFDAHSKLLLDDWAVRELHTPIFATHRTFRQTARYLCGCTTRPDSSGVFILTVYPWKQPSEAWQRIPCRDLLNEKK